MIFQQQDKVLNLMLLYAGWPLKIYTKFKRCMRIQLVYNLKNNVANFRGNLSLLGICKQKHLDVVPGTVLFDVVGRVLGDMANQDTRLIWLVSLLWEFAVFALFAYAYVVRGGWL